MKRLIKFHFPLALAVVLMPSVVSASCGPLDIELAGAGNVRLQWGDACQLQVTTSLEGTPAWADVSGTSPLVLAVTGTKRFFRTLDGANASPNIVGYVNLSLPAGDSLIANPLNHGNNHLNSILLLPGTADGTTIRRFKPDTQNDGDLISFLAGSGWSTASSQPAWLVLEPGEGFWIQPSGPTPLVVAFVGEVPQCTLNNPVPANLSLLSSKAPQALPLGEMGAAGTLNFPAADGDEVQIWDPASQTFKGTYSYVDGFGWFSSNPDDPGPQGPTIPVGTAFRVQRVAPAATWTQTFNPSGACPTNPCDPISITVEPADKAVQACSTATFSVGVTGNPVAYIWLRDGAPISGANSSSYTTPSLTPQDDGSVYTVIISNSCSTVTSRQAHLTVLLDLIPPTLDLAVADCVSNKVTLTFSEAMAGPQSPVSALDYFYYSIDGNVLISGAAFGADSKTVCLFIDPSTPLAIGVSYTLTVDSVTDLCGNTIEPNPSSFSFTCPPAPCVPTLTCASNKTAPCHLSWTFDLPTNSCTNLIVTEVSTFTNGTCPKLITRTWSITDQSSNSHTCSQTVTLEDTTPPIITQCPSNQTLTAENCAALIPDLRGQVAATDDCGTVVITQSPMLAPVGLGTYPVVFTVCDDCTNCVTCTNLVTVVGAQEPNLVSNGSFEEPVVSPSGSFNHFSSVPGWSGTDSANNPAAMEFWNGNFGSMSPFDGQQHLEINGHISGQTVSQVIANLDTNCLMTLCFWHVGRRNFADNRFQVEIIGSGLAPATLHPPAYINAGSWQSYCVDFVPTASTITIAFTALSNPSITGGAHIDNISLKHTSPLITCATNKTVECGSLWTFDMPAALNTCCTNGTISVLDTATNGAACSQSITRTWQAIDCCGNTNTCSQTVTVVDATPPIITQCPSNQTLTAENCAATIPDLRGQVAATDNCGTVVITQSPILAPVGLGTYPVVFTVCDDCTNCVTCTNLVTVVGAQEPNLVSNGSFEEPVVSPSGSFNHFSSVPGWSGTDGANNPAAMEFWNGNLGSMSPFDGQQHLEINGHISGQTVSQVIANLDTNCLMTLCFWHVGRRNFTDNRFQVEIIGSGLAPATLHPPAYINAGSWQSYCVDFVPTASTITIAFTALSNPSITGGAHIDNVSLKHTSPLIACATNKTAECGSLWTFDMPAALNTCCTNGTISVLDTATNGTACSQSITRTWQAIDCCGNTNTCSQTVTVVDTTPPLLACAADKTVDCAAPWDFDPPTASDLCGANVTVDIVSTVTNGVCPWVHVRTWRATDSCGNSNTCTQMVTARPAGECVAGQTWTPHESFRLWTSVASSADGSKLIAGAYLGQIYTSTDSGATWTARDSIRKWAGVASSSDGSKLVAVASQGQIYTSTDSGVSWTPRESNRAWGSVASSDDGTKLVAGVRSGGQIYTSTDSGVTWTPRAGGGYWWVASSADGINLVAADSGGQIHTSTDSGVTWTPRESNRNWTAVASSADGSKLVASVTPGQIYTSTDSGVTWTARESNRHWISVASSADGSKLVASEWLGRLYTSTDFGVTWTPRESVRAWEGVASSADGSKLVAVDNGSETGRIYTSTCTPSSLTLTCATNKTVECGSLWTFDMPTILDTCCTNATFTVLDTITNGSACSQLITRTWQAFDCCGNTNTCSQTVTVVDTTPPVFTGFPGMAVPFTNRPAWQAAVGNSTTIGFSTLDNGNPVSSASVNGFFPSLILSGAEFLNIQSYWDLYILVAGNQPNHINLPPGTHALGAYLSPFWGQPGHTTITLSTGESFIHDAALVPWVPDFFGVSSPTPIAWVEFVYNNDILIMDDFSFSANLGLRVRRGYRPWTTVVAMSVSRFLAV